MNNNEYYVLEISFKKNDYESILSLLYDSEIYTFEEKLIEDAVSSDSVKQYSEIIICYFATDAEMNNLHVILESKASNICNLKTYSKNDDYLNSWKEYAKVVNVSENINIIPSWLDEEDIKNQINNSSNSSTREKLNIILDPGYAFGSGSHETTILCGVAIEDIFYQKNPSSMLDVGCGSGVLSIIARMLGIENVEGIDIDYLSIQASNENAIKNNILDIKFSTTPLAHISNSYDMVVANILSNIILELSEYIYKVVSKGGTLILSGILFSEVDTFLEKISWKNSFNSFKIDQLGEWCSIKLTDKLKD